jgi:hypothetical protein
MALVLVSDTSVLIDLHRGQLLEPALRLPYDFAVPDLLFERELRTWDSAFLRQRLKEVLETAPRLRPQTCIHGISLALFCVYGSRKLADRGYCGRAWAA